jgi:asparagine synthase (glutamine-hydrolysing)
MCGIAGIRTFTRSDCSTDISDRLLAMSDAVAHRGPDGQGQWISSDRLIGLTHRRLSIVDLSTAASQPMQLEGDSIVVTYNGEIYNHIALRRELEAQGSAFTTDHSDTEVLLHGYRHWGLDGLLSRLDGMFAFALWDGAQRQLHVARDRAGVKPLYYQRDAQQFRFASEIKSLLADPAAARPTLSPGAFRLYLTFLVVPAPATMFENICKLPAGCCATLTDDGKWTQRRYWDAKPTQSLLTDQLASEDLATGVRVRFEQAVIKRMMSDVPFGILLSGGVDSSAIATIAARHATERLDSFTVGFEGNESIDETAHARAVASQLGLRHHDIRIGWRESADMLERMVYHQDEPIADWVCLPLFAVSRLAVSHGMKMVMAGEGADELFCGYDGYLAYVKFIRKYQSWISRMPSALAGLPAKLADILKPWSSRAEALAGPLRRAALGEPVFYGGAVGFAETNDLADVVRMGSAGPSPADIVSGIIAEMPAALRSAHPLASMTYLEFKLRLPELLLMRADKMSMAHGLELRVPFLDRSLIEYVLSVPPERRIAGGKPKALLKEALAPILPAGLLERRKVGFGLPIANWLRQDCGTRFIEPALSGAMQRDGWINRSGVEALFREHRDGRDRSVQLWALINAALWYERWIARA